MTTLDDVLLAKRADHKLDALALVTSDGAVVAGSALPELDLSALAGVAGSGSLLMQAIVGEVGSDQYDLVSIETTRHHVIIAGGLADDQLLLAIAPGEQPLGRVRLAAKRIREELAQA